MNQPLNFILEGSMEVARRCNWMGGRLFFLFFVSFSFFFFKQYKGLFSDVSTKYFLQRDNWKWGRAYKMCACGPLFFSPCHAKENMVKYRGLVRFKLLYFPPLWPGSMHWRCNGRAIYTHFSAVGLLREEEVNKKFRTLRIHPPPWPPPLNPC